MSNTKWFACREHGERDERPPCETGEAQRQTVGTGEYRDSQGDANPTCKLGTAEYGLNSNVVAPAASQLPASALSASSNPRFARRGGAVGNHAETGSASTTS